MKEVTISNNRLLTALKENRAKHAAEHEAATKGYREAVEAALSDCANNIRMGRMAPQQAVAKLAKMTAPTCHLDDYDRVILMLEMSSINAITLQAHEFSQYVQDEWGWKREFQAASATYTR